MSSMSVKVANGHSGHPLKVSPEAPQTVPRLSSEGSKRWQKDAFGYSYTVIIKTVICHLYQSEGADFTPS